MALAEAVKTNENFYNIENAMDAYAEKYGEKAARKNLTISAWLNTFAEKTHYLFSGAFWGYDTMRKLEYSRTGSAVKAFPVLFCV